MSLKGKTALVTGSGRNIGRGIALHLAGAGCNVVLNGSQDRAACETVAEKVRAAGAEAAAHPPTTAPARRDVMEVKSLLEAAVECDILLFIQLVVTVRMHCSPSRVPPLLQLIHPF